MTEVQPTPRDKFLSAKDPTTWKIKLLYDGLCPLCMREVNFLRRKDAGRGLVAFVDIADLNYDANLQGGVEFAEAMGRIHAVLPNGSILRDVEVFRQVYRILGMGWIYAPTRWPLVRPLVDRLYALWAAWRLPLTGRPSLAQLVAERERCLEAGAEGRCRIG